MSCEGSSCFAGRAKKVVSDSPLLVGFVIGLVNFVFNLYYREVKVFGRIWISEELKSNCLNSWWNNSCRSKAFFQADLVKWNYYNYYCNELIKQIIILLIHHWCNLPVSILKYVLIINPACQTIFFQLAKMTLGLIQASLMDLLCILW